MNQISSQVATVDYLQLLTVQLRNQDPIDPVKQEGLIDDLTQFSMLEGIEDMNTSFQQILQLQQVSQGIDLVGKTVQFQDPVTGAIRSGEASEMFNNQGEIRLAVDGQSIGLQHVISVKQRP